MEKPQPKTVITYDLLEVLKYADNEVKGFKDEIWEELYEVGYINNDTCVSIPFEDFANAEYYNDAVVEGAKYLVHNLPEILEDNVLFDICW